MKYKPTMQTIYTDHCYLYLYVLCRYTINLNNVTYLQSMDDKYMY